MNKITFFIALGAVICACTGNKTYNVSGTVENAKDSMLYIEASTLEGVKVLDSLRLKDGGEYRFAVEAPTDCPEFFALRIGQQRIPFSIDSTECVRIDASLPHFTTEYKVEGNESSKRIREIYALQLKLQNEIVELEKNKDMFPGDIIDSINVLLRNYKEKMKEQYIFSNASSASAYYAVCQSITDLQGTWFIFNPLTDRDDVKTYAAVASGWDCYYPDAQRTEQLCNAAIKGLNNTAEKTTPTISDISGKGIEETGIIEVELPDISNKMRSLKELKGKVVLLDFTVFGAPESAERTRLLRSLYEKYAAKGFEIYQISLDDDIHFWKSSVEYLPWISVHETNGVATAAYAVSNVPTFFLINKENEIVLRSDFMKGTLEDNLKKLL